MMQWISLCALLCVASVGSTDVVEGWQMVTENWYVVRIGGATAGVLQVRYFQHPHVVSSPSFLSFFLRVTKNSAVHRGLCRCCGYSCWIQFGMPRVVGPQLEGLMEKGARGLGDTR